jgi:hypothetical protein
MEEPSNPKTMIELTTTNNASPIPHHCHSMNHSTLSSTLYPGTTTRYRHISGMNPLEVTMKKPSWNPKPKQDPQHILMKPHLHPRHEGTHLLGVTYQEGSMNGTRGQGVSKTKNNPGMKRTFRNEVAVRTTIQNKGTMRTMMWTIW